MDDLIERMDAIDVLKKSYVHEDGIHYWRDHNNDCIDKLIKKFNLIPSADRPQGEWIPCSERLPDERQDVYVTVFWDDYGDTITAYGRRTQFGWSLWNTVEGELLKGYTVTAWMPLPKPWKGATMRNRCCCNCRRNIRTADESGYVRCHCEIDGHYIGYVECFEEWCRHWAKDKWQEERSE